MAKEERHMAESSVIPEAAREVPKSQLVIVGSSGEYKGVYRPPESPKPPEDPFISPEDRQMLEEVAKAKGGSKFARAEVMYDYLMGYPVQKDPALRAELEGRQIQSRTEIERLNQEAEDHPLKPLREATKALLDAYKRIKSARLRELQGGGRQDVAEHERGRGPIQERIFKTFKELAPLGHSFGGLLSYRWEGVMEAISAEEGQINKTDRTIKNPLAERIFAWMKRQRSRDRMSAKELRYSQAESYWGGEIVVLFTWPETAREMILTAMAWAKDRLADIGERDPGTSNKETEDIIGRGPMLLKNARIRINSEPVLVAEHGEISETNPEYLRARAFAEGVPNVFANEMIMKKGNKEFGPQAKERFAAKFIKNFEAVYLENKYAAYLMYRLARYKDGTYWTGHDWSVEKPLEGEVKDYRAQIQEELLAEATARGFFTETVFANNQDLFSQLIDELISREPDAVAREVLKKEIMEDIRLGYTGFFELREKSKLQYSFDDPLETLLLDSDNKIRQRIVATGDAEALRRHDLRVVVFRRTKEMLTEKEGLGFADIREVRQLEKLMRRLLSDEELAWLTERGKAVVRLQIQQHLRSQGHDPDQYKDWIEEQIAKEGENRRQTGVRKRIRQQMEKISKSSSDFAQRSTKDMTVFDEAFAKGDLTECNRLAWIWVKDYNHYRIEFHLPKWYPSGWDRVRIKIDRAAKVIDRSLTDEEFEAMYEKAYLPQVSEEDEDGQARITDIIAGRKEDVRFGFELARSFEIFQMEDTLFGSMRTRLRAPKGFKLNGKDVSGEYIGRLPDNETSLLLGLIREKKDPQTGRVMKDAEGNIIYETVDPDRKTIRVWDVVEARLAAAIKAEEEAIKPLRQAKLQAEMAYYFGGRTPEAKKEYEQAATALRKKLVSSQFVATLALKARGLVNGRLPVWSHSYLDSATIRAFGEAMAEYGVELAPGIPFADYKKEIYEYLERGRRGLVSELERASKEFMEGRFPFYERDVDGNIVYEQELDKEGNPVMVNGQPKMIPKVAISILTAADDWGEPGPMNDRFRDVDKGPVAEDAEVTEAEFNISSSGGVKFVEYISHARLNYFPLGVWLASKTILDLNNYIKGRNEVEYHNQRFFDPTDAPKNAKAQAAAYIARRALTGGSLGEGQSAAGFLQEPFDGAYKIADLLFSWSDVVQGQANLLRYHLVDTTKYIGLRFKIRQGQDLAEDEKTELERTRQMSYLEFDKMHKEKMQDPLYNTSYGILKNFTTWLKAEKEVEQNRIGNAPRNYAYENTKRWYAFRRLMRESVAKGDKGFIERLGYAGEITNEMVIKMMEVGLRDAEYLILTDYERGRLALEGSEILSRALTPQERQVGFFIPDESKWSSKPERIRKALEDIRRRGLLEFMQEEGYKIVNLDENGKAKRDYSPKNEVVYKNYKGEVVGRAHNVIYFKEVLGNKIPPLVQHAMIYGDRTHDLRSNDKLLASTA